MSSESVEIAKKKSKVSAIIINKIKLYKVLKNVPGNIFSIFQGFFKDKK